MKRQHCKVFLPPYWLSLKYGTWWNTLWVPFLFAFNDLSGQVSPGIMKVYGLMINVGVKCVLVEENRATFVMGHVESIREKLVVNILGRLLQREDMPLSCKEFFESIFFSPTESSVPVVDAESPVHNRMGLAVCSGTVQVRSSSVHSLLCSQSCAVPLSMSTICPTRISSSLTLDLGKNSWRVGFLVTGKDNLIWERQDQTPRKRTKLTWTNEITFLSWPQRRQWCLNSFPTTCFIMKIRRLTKWRKGKLRHPRSLGDDFTLICGARSFRTTIADEDTFFQKGFLEWIFDPECTVENSAGAWERDKAKPKKNSSTYLQDLTISATLDETILNGCLKSTTTSHHMRYETWKLKRRNTNGVQLKHQPRILVATKDKSGWTQC